MRTQITPELVGVSSAGGILDRIVEAKALRLAASKLVTPIDELSAQARVTAASRRSFSAALGRRETTNIIAEIKRRSPSKGIIREQFDPAALAAGYATGGAAALSVLTEEDFFGGSLDHLRSARQAAKLPILRKDFVFDQYQLVEAAVAGADAVLLIVSMLEDDLLARLRHQAEELGLDALVEVHSEGEMRRAVDAGATIIGVNNRNLTTFDVDLNTSLCLAQLAPSNAVLVSESGITTGEDIRRLRAAGYSAFLIGEHFMRASEPGRKLATLIEQAGET